jgi:enoyl-[acyl-carrier protein] reductase II
MMRAVRQGDVESGVVICGQITGMLHDIKPVKQIMEDICKEAQEILKGFSWES